MKYSYYCLNSELGNPRKIYKNKKIITFSSVGWLWDFDDSEFLPLPSFAMIFLSQAPTLAFFKIDTTARTSNLILINGFIFI